MHRAVLLYLAVLVGCASGPPEQYHRGTFVRPPPAQVRPGVGLPRYDPHVKPLPPQPNPKPKRLLPPSDEPGLWATNGPGSSNTRRGAGPVVWDVTLPMPPFNQVEDPMEQVAPSAMCAKATKGKIQAMGLEAQVTSLPMHQRTCLLTRIYAFCLHRLTDTLGVQGHADAQRRVSRVANFASDFLAKWCAPLDTSSTDPLADRIERAWASTKPQSGVKQ